jgi:hypothetical protein
MLKKNFSSSNSIPNSLNSLLAGSNRLNEYYGGLNGKLETVDSLISNASILRNMDVSPQNRAVSPGRKHIMSNFAVREINCFPNGINNNCNLSSQR